MKVGCYFSIEMFFGLSNFQGEAFVPENLVRYGVRVEGREGVRTMRVEDDRIKYVY